MISAFARLRYLQFEPTTSGNTSCLAGKRGTIERTPNTPLSLVFARHTNIVGIHLPDLVPYVDPPNLVFV